MISRRYAKQNNEVSVSLDLDVIHELGRVCRTPVADRLCSAKRWRFLRGRGAGYGCSLDGKR